MMGREVKRVPLGFGWPLKETWPGYLTPEWLRENECPACDNGYSPRAKELYDQWWGYAPFRPENNGSVPFGPDHPAIVAFATHNVEQGPSYYHPGGVNGEARRLASLRDGMWAHHLNADDLAAINAARDTGITDPREYGVRSMADPFFGGTMHATLAISARCAREGVPELCSTCDGHAQIEEWPGQRATAEAFPQFDPPAGVGWQMWETTSAGSPISPVFETPEDLADWLQATGTSLFGSRSASREEWLGIITGDRMAAIEIALGVMVM